MSIKVVTLKEARASGRRFRPGYAVLDPKNSHRLDSGHMWYIGADSPLFNHPDVIPQPLKCDSCGFIVYVGKTYPDRYILERDEDELNQDAMDILNGLGIKVKDKVEV